LFCIQFIVTFLPSIRLSENNFFYELMTYHILRLWLPKMSDNSKGSWKWYITFDIEFLDVVQILVFWRKTVSVSVLRWEGREVHIQFTALEGASFNHRRSI
jgi:hypothetical protein